MNKKIKIEKTRIEKARMNEQERIRVKSIKQRLRRMKTNIRAIGDCIEGLEKPKPTRKDIYAPRYSDTLFAEMKRLSEEIENMKIRLSNLQEKL